jgi:hypothetical protein
VDVMMSVVSLLPERLKQARSYAIPQCRTTNDAVKDETPPTTTEVAIHDDSNDTTRASDEPDTTTRDAADTLVVNLNRPSAKAADDERVVVPAEAICETEGSIEVVVVGHTDAANDEDVRRRRRLLSTRDTASLADAGDDKDDDDTVRTTTNDTTAAELARAHPLKELKEMASALGLATHGKKAEIAARILAARTTSTADT